MPGRKADEKKTKMVSRNMSTVALICQIFQFYYGTLLGRPILH